MIGRHLFFLFLLYHVPLRIVGDVVKLLAACAGPHYPGNLPVVSLIKWIIDDIPSKWPPRLKAAPTPLGYIAVGKQIPEEIQSEGTSLSWCPIFGMNAPLHSAVLAI